MPPSDSREDEKLGKLMRRTWMTIIEEDTPQSIFLDQNPDKVKEKEEREERKEELEEAEENLEGLIFKDKVFLVKATRPKANFPWPKLTKKRGRT